MTDREFCFWLQGFFELQPGLSAPTVEQTKAIREHLALVFEKITPPVGACETKTSGSVSTVNVPSSWSGTRVYC